MRRIVMSRLIAATLVSVCALAACSALIGVDDVSYSAANDAAASDSPLADTASDAATPDVHAEDVGPIDCPDDGGPPLVISLDRNADCDGGLVDLSKSTPHCGQCGHACEGTCAAGMCVPKTLFMKLPSPTLLFGVAGGSIYWAQDNGTGGSNFYRGSLDDGGSTTLTISPTVPLYTVAVALLDGPASTTLFFSGSSGGTSGVFSIGIDGGGPAGGTPLFLSHSPMYGLSTHAGTAAWTNGADTVFIAPTDGGDAATTVSDEAFPAETLVGDDGVYWLNEGWRSMRDAAPALSRVQAGSISRSKAMMREPQGLALHGAYVYWLESNRVAVVRLPRTLMEPQKELGSLDGGDVYATKMVIDSKVIYFLAGVDQNASALYALPRCGGIPVRVADIPKRSSGALAQDDQFVYWGTLEGEMQRIPKY